MVMHRNADDARMLHAGSPLADGVVAAAADWAVLLQCGATPQELEQWRCWRQAAPEHEVAWQRFAAMTRNLETRAAALPPGTARQVVDSVARQARGRRRAMKAMLGVAGAGALITLGSQSPSLRLLAADYCSATGQRRDLALADGTKLVLDTDTAVDVNFDAHERGILLRRGAIFISTGQDPSGRPLRVHTSHGSISPVGTRFTVRDLGARTTQVRVLEGAVQIRPRGTQAMWRLEAGRQADFDASHVTGLQALPAGAAAWLDGMLTAQAMPLDEFLDELGRYRPGLLRYDPSLARLRVTGTFPLQDTDQVLHLLEQILPLRVQQRTRYWVTVVPA